MVDRTDTIASSTADVLAARDGDRDAFARLVTSHMGLLHTVVRDHVHAPDDVADCVQETTTFGAMSTGPPPNGARRPSTGCPRATARCGPDCWPTCRPGWTPRP
ncbi:MAG: hypothetical protein U5K29_08725 [Acidimicrobiales bacterium]|nr:hypothetical protein [Acidimicrobiales bacterium]